MPEIPEFKPSFQNFSVGSVVPIQYVKLLKRAFIGSANCNAGDIIAVVSDRERDWSQVNDDRLFYSRAQKMIEQGLARSHKLASGESARGTSGSPPIKSRWEEDPDDPSKRRLVIESTTVKTKTGEQATTQRQKAGAI